MALIHSPTLPIQLTRDLNGRSSSCFAGFELDESELNESQFDDSGLDESYLNEYYPNESYFGESYLDDLELKET